MLLQALHSLLDGLRFEFCLGSGTFFYYHYHYHCPPTKSVSGNGGNPVICCLNQSFAVPVESLPLSRGKIYISVEKCVYREQCYTGRWPRKNHSIALHPLHIKHTHTKSNQSSLLYFMFLSQPHKGALLPFTALEQSRQPQSERPLQYGFPSQWKHLKLSNTQPETAWSEKVWTLRGNILLETCIMHLMKNLLLDC